MIFGLPRAAHERGHTGASGMLGTRKRSRQPEKRPPLPRAMGRNVPRREPGTALPKRSLSGGEKADTRRLSVEPCLLDGPSRERLYDVSTKLCPSTCRNVICWARRWNAVPRCGFCQCGLADGTTVAGGMERSAEDLLSELRGGISGS